MFQERKSQHILRHNLNLMRIFGIEIRQNSTNVQTQLWRILNVILAIASITFYGHCWWYNPRHLPTYCAVSMTIMAVVYYRVTTKNGRKILNLLDDMMLILSKDQLSMIEKYSLRRVIGFWTSAIVLIVNSFIISFVIKSTEFSKLIVTYPLPIGYVGLAINEIAFITINYIGCHMLVNCVFYVNVQNVLEQHAISIGKLAKTTKSSYGQQRAQMIQLITNLYLYHIKVKQFVNSTLGVVPLMTFVTTFVLYMSGISHVIMFGSQFSTLFLITCIVSFAIFYTSINYYLVCNASRATNELEACYSKITVIVSHSNSSDSQMVKEERDALYRTITCIGIEPASAYGLFNIDPTLVLSFPNMMVPFLVMIITTIDSMSRQSS